MGFKTNKFVRRVNPIFILILVDLGTVFDEALFVNIFTNINQFVKFRESQQSVIRIVYCQFTSGWILYRCILNWQWKLENILKSHIYIILDTGPFIMHEKLKWNNFLNALANWIAIGFRDFANYCLIFPKKIGNRIKLNCFWIEFVLHYETIHLDPLFILIVNTVTTRRTPNNTMLWLWFSCLLWIGCHMMSNYGNRFEVR